MKPNSLTIHIGDPIRYQTAKGQYQAAFVTNVINPRVTPLPIGVADDGRRAPEPLLQRVDQTTDLPVAVDADGKPVDPNRPAAAQAPRRDPEAAAPLDTVFVDLCVLEPTGSWRPIQAVKYGTEVSQWCLDVDAKYEADDKIDPVNGLPIGSTRALHDHHSAMHPRPNHPPPLPDADPSDTLAARETARQAEADRHLKQSEKRRH